MKNKDYDMRQPTEEEWSKKMNVVQSSIQDIKTEVGRERDI